MTKMGKWVKTMEKNEDSSLQDFELDPKIKEKELLFAPYIFIVDEKLKNRKKIVSWPFALVGGILCLLVSFVECSRPARKRGRVQERPLQKNVTQIVSKLGPVAKSYYFRFAIYLLIAGVSSPSLPTLLPAVCLALGTNTT